MRSQNLLQMATAWRRRDTRRCTHSTTARGRSASTTHRHRRARVRDRTVRTTAPPRVGLARARRAQRATPAGAAAAIPPVQPHRGGGQRRRRRRRRLVARAKLLRIFAHRRVDVDTDADGADGRRAAAGLVVGDVVRLAPRRRDARVGALARSPAPARGLGRRQIVGIGDVKRSRYSVAYSRGGPSLEARNILRYEDWRL